jgi:hypothetical protein
MMPSPYQAVENHRIEMSRILHFLENRLAHGDEVISLTCRPLFTPQKDFLALMSFIG